MSRRTTAALAAAVLTAALALVGCSGDDGADPSPSAGSSGPAESSPAGGAEAGAGGDAQAGAGSAAPARPRAEDCYRLGYAEAIAPTNAATPVPCRSRHTAQTVAVGRLDTLVAGHLLAVDSARVRAQVAAACPREFAAYVGGSEEERRLSMLRPVWFTPTVEESDAGASWYRCDAVALARGERLAPLTGTLRGVLDQPEGRARYAICGTAEPGTRGFERVICSERHSWRAVATVPFEGERYPGVDAVRAAGDTPCRDAGAAAAGGALDFEWGYEWPTADQWRAGQRYGICWAPAGE